MKTWKRIASVVLMMMMLVTMILPVWGDDPAPTYTITVKNLPASITSVGGYNIFEKENGTGTAYNIKSSSAWWSVILTYMGNPTESGDKYTGKGITLTMSIDGVYSFAVDSDFDAADFAAHLKSNVPAALGGKTDFTLNVINGETTLSGIKQAGYYFVNALDGFFFKLDSTNPSVTLNQISGTNSNDGKITIDNAVVGQDYTIYQILKLESFNQAQGAYAYKATTEWETFVKSATQYLSVDTQGYVTWIAHNLKCTDTSHTHTDTCYYTQEEEAANFAKLAKKYADENTTTITTKTAKTATSTTVTFENLNLGYYLVDTSLGTLCSLDTTDKQVTIKEKNAVPTVTKQVQEDSKAGEDDEWGAVNDADFGQVVNFKTTIEAKKGADSYVLHDEMDAGLTFDQSSVKIYKGSVDSANIVDNTNYELYDASSVVAGSDPEEKVIKDNCTFEIHFEQTYLDTITADTKLIVTYSATLNTNAVVGDNGNVNKTWLTYGDSSKTETANTTTYTWDFNVFKYTGTDTPLSGAEFELTKGTGSTITTYKFVDITTNTDTYPVYRISVDGDKTNTSVTVLDKITTDATGKFAIVGLDQDTYTLEEDTAPAGYNKLADTITVYVEKNTSNVIQIRYKPTKAEAESGTVPTDKTVPVLNNSGTELPSTGGVGTTIFYCAGAVLALGAFVLLITRKRMQKQ